MKKYVLEEIEEIEKKINQLAENIANGIYSTYGETLAAKMIETLNEILDYLKSEDPSHTNTDEIITRLPLLYLQIHKIN